MILEAAVGDSYGACHECTNPEFIAENNKLEYVKHPRLRGQPGTYDPVSTGYYTDDTQMSIALAEAMLDDDFVWNKEEIADKFVWTFKRNKRKGYTPYFLNVLLNSEDGKGMLSRINGRSDKSGAFMRGAPIGLYREFDEVVAKSKEQAAVTHNSWVGKNSAVGAALMTHYFYYDLGPKDDLIPWLRDNWFGDSLMTPKVYEVDGQPLQCWHPSENRRVRVHGWDCLHAALYAIDAHDNMADILKQCVAYGGDTDTVATVAMAAASCSSQIEQNLPRHLVENLEDGTYGASYLRILDQNLLERFPR